MGKKWGFGGIMVKIWGFGGKNGGSSQGNVGVFRGFDVFWGFDVYLGITPSLSSVRKFLPEMRVRKFWENFGNVQPAII